MRFIYFISLLLPLLLVFLAAQKAHAQTRLYIAPTQQGTGDGQTETDAAQYTNEAFWHNVQTMLNQHPVTVHFLPGDYIQSPLRLAKLGHPKNRLTLLGSDKTVFKIHSTDPKKPNTGFHIAAGCQNITVENLHFTGNGTVGYISHVRGSQNIHFKNCTWIDLPNIIYGATGTAPSKRSTPETASETDTHHITYENCTFKRVGTKGGAHMIYNAYGPQHIYVINSHFEDCAGDYVRFRDLTDYCIVTGSTFTSTGTYPPNNPIHRPFISMPLFSDVDPGDEWFGTHFFFAHNTFTYQGQQEMDGEKIPIKFYHKGFDPPQRRHLLTADEGTVLENGSPQDKKTLLKTNCAIDTDQIHVFENTYSGIAVRAVYGCEAAYGAQSKGWEKSADIFALFNSQVIGLDDWKNMSN